MAKRVSGGSHSGKTKKNGGMDMRYAKGAACTFKQQSGAKKKK
jgi:hypothetical protein